MYSCEKWERVLDLDLDFTWEEKCETLYFSVSECVIGVKRRLI